MVEIQDTYFRRFFVPIIISILIFCGIATLIVVPPGTQVNWALKATALKGGFKMLNK
jgi:hypothetical protein